MRLKIGDAGRFDAWMYTGGSGEFISNIDETDTILTPGDARQAITVGNFAGRVSWPGADGKMYGTCGLKDTAANPGCTTGDLQKGDLNPLSSLGATADGRQKPDISAPGTNIFSSSSRDFPA